MSDINKKFKVGDKVVRTVECEADYTVEQWGVYTVSKVDDEGCCVIFLEGIYDKEGKPDWFNPRNFELVKEEETMSEQITTDQTQNIADATPKTPYQEKGYTENSLFKFVGEDGQFDKGELIKLHYDDGDDCPDFKSTSRDRKRYCCLFEVEYVGEEGGEDMLPDYAETLTPKPVEDVVKQDNVNHPNHYKTGKTECVDALRKPIKSDGGSSPYYFSPLPQHIIEQIVETGGIEVKDIVRYCFDNDADCKDIIKALKRIRECKNGGGKEGVDVMYDTTKVKFFANELYEAEKANVKK